MTIGVLLLAAGRATRFGSDKRLATLPNGERMLAATLQSITATALPVLVCLDKRDEPAASLLPAAVPRCYCERAAQGMGATLAEGLRAIPDWDATLIALADMPRVRADTWRALAAAASKDRIVIPVFRGRRGHPVAFGSRFYPSLRQLDGETGGRSVINGNADCVHELDCEDAGILLDIDTLQAMQQLQQ